MQNDTTNGLKKLSIANNPTTSDAVSKNIVAFSVDDKKLSLNFKFQFGNIFHQKERGNASKESRETLMSTLAFGQKSPTGKTCHKNGNSRLICFSDTVDSLQRLAAKE
ncbi:MAG: hypothetical protein AAB509_03050 [Patescibacteria group bacterium]